MCRSPAHTARAAREVVLTAGAIGSARLPLRSGVSTPRPQNALLSGRHPVYALREWRGDTHGALLASAGLTSSEASIVHNEWLGYTDDWDDWLSRSRGWIEQEIDEG
ncbi:hypothetical protein FB563_0052 [Streptomyces puniciscabiei]|uniref:Uncharacterized protein n=1 Tax=Streptomyces puniciscabiei TaxID=164348 RepID=A0A542U833_9ACTN|nr:hypothetical protein FB563_0052 [Streptomyces puniciscabiei]